MSQLPCPPELWPEFSALLDEGLELPEEARAAWLQQLAPEHAALKPWLTRALAHAGRLVTGDLRQPVLAESEFRAGQIIGPWCLERPLGSGGMGEVWLAGRADGSLKRLVALKLPYSHLIAGTARRRFERERDILAALAHPNIAQLYDAGVSDSGYPYLAMEWIEGTPVTRYCDERACGLEQRIEVFQQILQAVQYAHMHLVAHRDVKPSNILVTSMGQVKLLDFGIAKLLRPEENADLTQLGFGGKLLTLDYAAPEQLAGGVVTTASDVYSLGILLFVLLTGKHPFDDRRRNDASELPLASTCIGGADVPAGLGDVGSLRRALRGDLDAILAQAMQPDPARRYPSALAFAADLERRLQHQPISARRIGALSLAGKFLRRHRLGAAVALVLLLTAATGLAGILWQARLAQREARRETAEKNFLIGVFKASDPRVATDKPRDQVTARDLLDSGAQRASSGFFGDRDAQIELLGTLAEIYYELGDTDQYRTLRGQQLQLAAQRYGRDNGIAIDALLFEASEEEDLGHDFGNAQTLLRQADALMQRVSPGDSLQRAQWWYAWAMTLQAHTNTDSSYLDALLKACALYAKYGPRSEGYAEVLADTGGYYYGHGDLPQAASYEQHSVRVFGIVDDPDRSELARLYSNLGNTLDQLGQLDAAEAAFTQSLDLLRRTRGESHPSYWIPAASYALQVHWRGDRTRALQIFERMQASIPSQQASSQSALNANEIYAYCLTAEGRAAKAIPLLEAAERADLSSHLNLPRVRERLALAYQQVGRADEARRELKYALDSYVAMRAPDNEQVLRARERWGALLLEQHDLPGAEAQFREVARWTHVADQGQLFVALANGGLARVALARADSTQALGDIAVAEQTFDSLRASHDVRWGPYLWLIHAQALQQSGDLHGARQWAQRAFDADQRYDAPSSPELAQARAVIVSLQLPAAPHVTACTPTDRC